MLSLLIAAAPALIPALVAVFGLAVALKARGRVLATSGALTSTAVFAWLTVVGWEFGPFAWSLGAVTAFNLLLAVAVATDGRTVSGTPRLVVDRYPDAVEQRDGLTGRTLTVERLTPLTPGVAEVPFAWGQLGVVQRADGELVMVRAVARPEESAATMGALAQVLTDLDDEAEQ